MLFDEKLFYIFCLFSNWIVYFFVVDFWSSLCILDTSPLSDMWFVKVSSWSAACLFIFLTGSSVE